MINKTNSKIKKWIVKSLILLGDDYGNLLPAMSEGRSASGQAIAQVIIYSLSFLRFDIWIINY